MQGINGKAVSMKHRREEEYVFVEKRAINFRLLFAGSDPRSKTYIISTTLLKCGILTPILPAEAKAKDNP